MAVATVVVPPPRAAMVTGTIRSSRSRRIVGVPGRIRISHGHANPPESQQENRRACKPHQQCASDQQVTSGSIVRLPSVGLVTEM
jgi:hypothetical protein